MENFQRRRAARIVAYIDLVLTGVYMLAVTLVVFLALFTHSPQEVVVEWDGKMVTVLETLMWLSIVLALVIGGIELWAAIMLLKSTTQGAEPTKALYRARIWKNIMIISLAASTIQSLATFHEWGGIIFEAIETTFRVILIYFVVKFIQELDHFVKSGGAKMSECPDVVVNGL